MSDLEEQ